jgi:magnesium transporter
VIVDCGIYDGGVRRAGTFTFEEAYEASRSPGTFVWLGLFEPTGEEFASVRSAFSLHELAVEDALKAHQRPKLEVYDDTLFIVVKTARYVDSDEVVALGELLLFVGRNFVVAVRHGEASPLVDTRRRVEKRPELLRCGPGAVLWAILDHVVDDYLPVLDGLEHDIDQVENEVFASGRENPAERIYFLKRELMEFLRGVRPLLDPLDRLARGSFELLHEDVRAYFRDVHDHLVRVVEQLEGDRDLLTSILQSNLTQLTVRQNEDMRKISAWAAIFAIPTMIAGIYGMNFQHMPELKAVWGYPFALGLMASVCAALWAAFKRSGWL